MRRLAGGPTIAYTTPEAFAFSAELPKFPVVVAPNALYRIPDIAPARGDYVSDAFLFSGRLETEKGAMHCLEEFLTFHGTVGHGPRLLFIGDGFLKPTLEAMAAASEASDSIQFFGSVYDVAELRRLYAESAAAVVGGYVGLNAVQCLGFGIPLIFPANPLEPHAPEAYLLSLSNSVSYTEGAGGLAKAMQGVWDARSHWALRREEISKMVREAHNVEAMAEGFLKAVRSS